MSEETDDGAKGYGITDEDRLRIEKYLQKQKYERNVDDLRPSSNQ